MKTEAEGSLTIFSALSLLLILSFLLALLEGARVSGLQMMDTLAADTGMDCVAAEYQTVLWDKYHLLYLDGAYGWDQFDENKVSSRVMDYVAGNLSETGENSVFRTKLCEASLLEYMFATDNDGTGMLRQASAYMKRHLPEDVAKKMYQQYQDGKKAEADGKTEYSVEDADQAIINAKKEKEAFELCNKKIKEHKLEMTLTDVEYKFDNSKILFYFTADGRIDFRELVKDLAAIYKTRIELRQIGVRDEVKRIGGNGVCGRELCCCTFLNNFDTVSIKMAKEQNIALNPAKISGNCGRLMCCLKYEQNVYEDKMKKLPHPGAIVKTGEGEGTVESVEVLREIIKVKLNDEEGNSYYKKYNVADVQIIKDSKKEIKSDDNIDPEELKELEKIEQMDKYEKKNTSKDEE